MTDTAPEIAEMVRARLMARSGAERFRMGVEMRETPRRIVLALMPADLSERTQTAFVRTFLSAAAARSRITDRISRNPAP